MTTPYTPDRSPIAPGPQSEAPTASGVAATAGGVVGRRRVSGRWVLVGWGVLGAATLAVVMGMSGQPPRVQASQQGESTGAPSRPERQPARSGPRTADIAVAQTTSFDIQTTAVGELAARNQIEIRSQLETPSSIVEVVPEGVRVRRGDLLIKLNSDEIQTKVEEEKLRVESAKAELVAAENSYEIQVNENASAIRQSKLKLDLARLALRQWEDGQDKEERQRNQLQVEKTEREFQRLKDKLDRSQRLFDQGFLSKDELERDRISLLEAEAARKTAILSNEIYENFQRPKDEKTRRSDVEEAEAELQRVERRNEIELASKAADRTNKREQLRIRQSRLQKQEDQLKAATIVAPQDGLVVYGTSLNRDRGWSMGGGDGPLQIGRQVRPNELLIVLPDTSEMIATVRVQESLAGRIRPGQTATLKIDAVTGKAFTGRVESIGVLAESGGWRDPNLREYTVRLAIDDNENVSLLKPSMRAEAEIQLGRADNVLAVPLQAVFNDGVVRFVYMPSGNRFVRVPVRLGRRSEIYAEIAAGLKAGQEVLVRQPTPGEVLDEPWNPEELKVAGFTLGEDGKPVAIMPAGGGGRRSGGGAPAAAAAGGDAAGAAAGGGQTPAGAPGQAMDINSLPPEVRARIEAARRQRQAGGGQPGAAPPAATPPAAPSGAGKQ